jgi:tetratricopeptide (TPR) repeat protein
MDTGQHGAAHDHAQAAVRLAELAGHPGVTAWARGLQASNAFWAGNYARSAAIAATALPEARHGTTRVFLACLLARASGRTGNRRDIADALAHADLARDHADADEVGGVFAFSEAKQHLYAATAYLGPGGDPARALTHAQRAVKQYADAPTRSFGDEAGARIDVATAHLHLGEPDGALEALEPVLALPPRLRVATIRTRMRRVRGELERGFADLPAAHNAIERITAFEADAIAA